MLLYTGLLLLFCLGRTTSTPVNNYSNTLLYKQVILCSYSAILYMSGVLITDIFIIKTR